MGQQPQRVWRTSGFKESSWSQVYRRHRVRRHVVVLSVVTVTEMARGKSPLSVGGRTSLSLQKDRAGEQSHPKSRRPPLSFCRWALFSTLRSRWAAVVFWLRQDGWASRWRHQPQLAAPVPGQARAWGPGVAPSAVACRAPVCSAFSPHHRNADATFGCFFFNAIRSRRPCVCLQCGQVVLRQRGGRCLKSVREPAVRAWAVPPCTRHAALCSGPCGALQTGRPGRRCGQVRRVRGPGGASEAPASSPGLEDPVSLPLHCPRAAV